MMLMRLVNRQGVELRRRRRLKRRIYQNKVLLNNYSYYHHTNIIIYRDLTTSGIWTAMIN